MPSYISSDGELHTLSRRAAADVAAFVALEEVDATGQPVPKAAAALAAEIEQLRAHEQVSILEAALAAAQARVDEIAALLRTAQETLTAETADVTAKAAARAAEEVAAAAQREQEETAAAADSTTTRRDRRPSNRAPSAE